MGLFFDEVTFKGAFNHIRQNRRTKLAWSTYHTQIPWNRRISPRQGLRREREVGAVAVHLVQSFNYAKWTKSRGLAHCTVPTAASIVLCTCHLLKGRSHVINFYYNKKKSFKNAVFSTDYRSANITILVLAYKMEKVESQIKDRFSRLCHVAKKPRPHICRVINNVVFVYQYASYSFENLYSILCKGTWCRLTSSFSMFVFEIQMHKFRFWT